MISNMRKVLLALAMMMPLVSFAQDDSEKQQTKFEQLASKTGKISKFVDVKMPRLSYLETSIRTVLGEQENQYFYRIEKPETSTTNSRIAMIEYSDLVEINKALTKLLSEVDADCESNPDYLENRFITDDGFRIGYYVDNGKANWFIRLERYGKSTVFIKKEVLAENFPQAQKKIEELKGKE
jgi:hypothetical protein